MSATIPLEATVELARTSAEAIDSKVEGVSAELQAAIESAGWTRALRRSEHRREHLDQIERALGR